MTAGIEMLDKAFRKKGEIVSRKIAGETILVPVTGRLADMRRIFSLNAVAEYIWDRLDGERSLRNIAGEIVAVFGTGRETAEADALEFVSGLEREGLIEAVE